MSPGLAANAAVGQRQLALVPCDRITSKSPSPTMSMLQWFRAPGGAHSNRASPSFCLLMTHSRHPI